MHTPERFSPAMNQTSSATHDVSTGPDKPNLRRVVHDLRNVIAPLRNAAQLLRIRSRTDDKLAPIADIIDRQVDQMVRMLNELAGAATAEPSANSEAHVKPPHAAANRPRRVLIVDDNVALLNSLSSVLREAGHGVRTAEDGRQALEVAAQWQPEVVLLDAAMPHMNGFEVARELRAAYPREAMKLVLMSGSTLDDATRRGAERAGFDCCVDKIHSFTTLESILVNRG